MDIDAIITNYAEFIRYRINAVYGYIPTTTLYRNENEYNIGMEAINSTLSDWLNCNATASETMFKLTSILYTVDAYETMIYEIKDNTKF